MVHALNRLRSRAIGYTGAVVTARGEHPVEHGARSPAVLIVDDNEPNLLALEAVLLPLGYRVTRASSGEEALHRIRERDFDLVLLDVMMPGMDGYETATRIRQETRLPEIPIVFVTALDTTPADLMKGYASGGADYLVKPFDPDVLRAKVAVFVELHGIREQLRRQDELLQVRAREGQSMRSEVRDANDLRGEAESRETAYRFLAESIPQQVWTSCPDGALDYVSPVVEKYFGQPATTILGSGWLGVLHPDDAQRAVAMWGHSLATGEPYEIEFRLRRHDGTYRWHLGRAVAERGPGGEITKWFGTNTDIDDRRAMELELRAGQAALRDALERVEASEHRFHLLAESMPQVMWSLNADASNGYLNARWYEYTGQDPDLPMTEKWLQALHPEDHASCFETWTAAQTDHHAWELQYRLRRHDGVYRWHLGRSVPQLGNDGTAVEWYGTATDIHEQRMAIRSRDELLATVSHDLRNSLGTISLAVELMEGEVVEPGLKRSAGSIRRAANRMEQLLRDLLDVATIESGHLTISPASWPVDTLLLEASAMVQERATPKGIELVTTTTPSGTRVQCDRHRILQVFANLASNAIKFTPSGGTITLAARVDAPVVTFMVRDTGAGIEPAQIDHVFDRFWKSKDSEKGGTGLGLAICQGIVQQHGGTIWVESTVGAGTTLFFTLPLA